MSDAGVLVLRWPTASCVVQASDVAAVEPYGPSARRRVGEPVWPLAAHVPGASDDPAHTPILLVIRTPAGVVGFHGAVAIAIGQGLRFYALPRLLRAAGSPAWLRGLALIPDDPDHPLPWLDLAVLAAIRSQKVHLGCAEGRA